MLLYHGAISTNLPTIYRRGIEPRGFAAGNWLSIDAEL
jgi:hypothetical protein